MGTIMNVYYGSDNLPYKDSARTVHYPIVGNSFTGASLVDEIRFYIDRIGSVTENTFVAIAKRADGKKGYKILESETDETINETYVSLQLSQWFTAKKGDLYISLNVYKGGVETEVDPETNLNIISGVPIIQVTGSIKLSINYTPMMNENYGEVPTISVQEALALVSSISKSGVKDIEITSIKTAQEVFDEVGGVNHIFGFDLLGIKSFAIFVETDTDTYDLEIWNENGTRAVSPIDLTQLFRTELDNAVIKTIYLPIIVLSSAMQTLTSDELKILEQDNSVIKYNGRVYIKSSESTQSYEYVSADYDYTSEGGYYTITKYTIIVNKESGSTQSLESYFQLYNKAQVDALLDEKTDKSDFEELIAKLSTIIGEKTLSTSKNDNVVVPTNIDGYPIMNTTKTAIVELGGNSQSFNQQVEIQTSSQSQTINGITITDNRDGSFTFNGTATTDTYKSLGGALPIIIGHKYLLKGGNGGSSSTYYLTQNSSGGANDYGNGVIYTQPNNSFGRFIVVVIKSGATLNNVVFRPQHFDLTLMGLDSITTVNEFNALFPLEYYPYNEGEIFSTILSNVKSYSIQSELLGTINIPNAPLTLNGVNDIHNLLTFVEQEDGTYNAILTRNAIKKSLNDITAWSKQSNANATWWEVNSTVAEGWERAITNLAICSHFSQVTENQLKGANYNNCFARATNFLLIKNDTLASLNTREEVKEYLNSLGNVEIVYVLETPTTETIASGLTFDQVSTLFEKGGTLQINNSETNYVKTDSKFNFVVWEVAQ